MRGNSAVQGSENQESEKGRKVSVISACWTPGAGEGRENVPMLRAMRGSLSNWRGWETGEDGDRLTRTTPCVVA